MFNVHISRCYSCFSFSTLLVPSKIQQDTRDTRFFSFLPSFLPLDALARHLTNEMIPLIVDPCSTLRVTMRVVLLLSYLAISADCFVLHNYPTNSIRSLSERWAVHVIDGPHWKTLQKFYFQESKETSAVRLDIEISNGKMKLNDKELKVKIPDGISEEQAEATLLNALTIHAALPQDTNNDIATPESRSKTSEITGRVLIIGGSKQAKAFANGLEALGVTVSLVSSQPGASIDPTDTDFSEEVGSFDALIDTIGDESRHENILKLLKEKHNCHTYISTVSMAQTIVAKEGLLWGPGKAGDHMNKLKKSPPKATITSIPENLESTIDTLMKNRCSFPPKKGPVSIPGWSLSDAMELNMWPMDKWGANMIRFGFPVKKREMFYDDEDDNVMVAAPPSRGKVMNEDDMKEEEPIPGDPIIQVAGMRGLEDRIIREKLDCVLFLKAPYCRTCRKLMPRYRQMAKSERFVFAQADATGVAGKELGRNLGVSAVPAFVFFRGGKRFGLPLGITKLPNQKLEAALELLRSGKDWDEELISKAGRQ